MSSVENIPAQELGQPYAQVPLAALAGLGHKKNALAVWICYRYHQGRNPHAFVSQARVAQELSQDGHSVSRTAVYHVTRWLVENGWLAKQQRGQRKTNLVACRIPDRFAQPPEQPTGVDSQTAHQVLGQTEPEDAQPDRVPYTNRSELNNSVPETDQGSGGQFGSWAAAVKGLQDSISHTSLRLLDEAYLFEEDGVVVFAPGVPSFQQLLIQRYVSARFLEEAA